MCCDSTAPLSGCSLMTQRRMPQKFRLVLYFSLLWVVPAGKKLTHIWLVIKIWKDLTDCAPVHSETHGHCQNLHFVCWFQVMTSLHGLRRKCVSEWLRFFEVNSVTECWLTEIKLRDSKLCFHKPPWNVFLWQDSRKLFYLWRFSHTVFTKG